jgi:hypothetical protein
VPLSSTSTEIDQLNISDSEEGSPADVDRILRDISTKMPIMEPLAVIMPKQTEVEDRPLAPEVAHSEPMVAEPTEPMVVEPAEPTIVEPVYSKVVATEFSAFEFMATEPMIAASELGETEQPNLTSGEEPVNLVGPT